MICQILPLAMLQLFCNIAMTNILSKRPIIEKPLQQIPELQPHLAKRSLSQRKPAQQLHSCTADLNLYDLCTFARSQLSMFPTSSGLHTEIQLTSSRYADADPYSVSAYLHHPLHLHILENLLDGRPGYGLVTGRGNLLASLSMT